jgi:GTPase SAR1 family protein
MLEAHQLTGKPFEITHMTKEMAGRKAEWHNLLARLESAFKGNSCKFIVLVGDYGYGKTFTVERLYSRFKTRDLEFTDTLVVRTTLTGAPIRASPTESVKARFGIEFVNRIFANIGPSDLHDIAVKTKVDRHSVSEMMVRILEDLGKNAKVGFKILAGMEIDSSELRGTGLRPIRDASTALSCLYDFQMVLKKAGYNNLLVILDEFEYIMHFSPSRITAILNTLREIFDNYGILESRDPGRRAKIVFLFAISPGGWDALRDLEASAVRRTGGGGIAPFVRRVSAIDVITLLPLNPDQIVELLKLRLSEHRKSKVPNPLHPFTREAAYLIGEISEGVPSRALDYAGIVLEVASERGLDRIDVADVRKILGELNLYHEKRRRRKR